MSLSKEDAAYYKSKHIIESNSKDSTHMDGLAVDYNVPKEHKERYEDEIEAGIFKEAYDKILEVISFYLDIDDDKKKIMALWVIGTYFHEEFETFPLLFLNAMRGSAKSRTVRLLTKLSKNGKMLMNMTEAGLFRSEGTLGIDEFESLGSKEKQSLRELLNSAYKKGSQIIRMKKKKSLEGEEIVPEYFEAFRPIILANIWGIEEVLADRCLTIVLEKSNDPNFIKLMENYESDNIIKEILLLLGSEQCSLCSVVTKKNINNYTNWNIFVKNKSTLYTLTTLTTHTTLTTQQQQFFETVYNLDINGRNLELFYPLFLIAKRVGDETFKEVLEIAKDMSETRKVEEFNDSSDVTLYSIVAACDPDIFYQTQDIVNIMSTSMGSGNFDWLNNKWMGRALKRLNLVVEKKRVAKGMMVRLNIEKALTKLEMFK